MMAKRYAKNRLVRAVFGCFFGIISMLGLVSPMMGATSVYAEPETGTVSGGTLENSENVTDTEQSGAAQNNESGDGAAQDTTEGSKSASCESSLGALGWLVCPTTGVLSKAVDWLYEKIEGILVINPVEMKDGSPVYEIWKYMRGITNIVFIIFLLVVIYSQITGIGITNYGIKKVLPKLIVAAVLVNLSFIICSLLVDASNIVGAGLRGIFTNIQEATAATTNMHPVAMSDVYLAMSDGAALTIGGGLVAFELGAIWMLIPTVLGAIVAVAIGLVTIALRQAVVVLLIMIAPLAVVAYMLPNTEQWFKKWKQLLYRMLIFYPMFSLLFGASQLAGWAIIMAAKDGFGVILGIAVQIFPLFFAVSLMKMSGTFLSGINAGLTRLASGPLMVNRSWAQSRRDLTRARNLASGNVYTPTLRLQQFLSDRRIAREKEIAEKTEVIKARGLSYRAQLNYKNGNLDGVLSKLGRDTYEDQARVLEYKATVERDNVNYNKGFGYRVKAGTSDYGELNRLDDRIVKASDRLRMETERGAQVEYENAKGFYERIANAKTAYMDSEALKAGNTQHQLHTGVLTDSNLERYETMKRVMENKDIDTSFILAGAAHAFNGQAQVVKGKFNDLFSYTAPTQDLVNILSELTKSADSNSYIDPIIAGLRTLNARGDTDLVRKQVENLLDDGKVELGTYVSQSLANFCMFDVKGTDPLLRRFGKYINLETARMFNEKKERRTRKDISLDEFVNGEYIDMDNDGNVLYDEDGNVKYDHPKRAAAVLMKGTSFKDIERTALSNMNEVIRNASYDTDANGNRIFNYEKFKKNQTAIWDAIMPNIISDQFTFLSGSEQIMSLGKSLTGMDVKDHKLDWKEIFGETLADSLTSDQKMDYLEFLKSRTQTFLGGHVPSQIAKTKTDILESVRNQFAFEDAAKNDPEFLAKASDEKFKMSSDEYKAFEKEHIDKVKEEFVGSFKEDALKGFVKMHHKGYQGEAKDGLIQLLNPDDLYRKYFGSGEEKTDKREKRKRDFEDEDDDGAPVDFGGYDAGAGSAFAEARNDIEAVFQGYRGTEDMNVREFWSDIKPMISELPGVGAVFVDEIESGLSQYTSVAALYAYIVNRLFGGFGD